MINRREVLIVAQNMKRYGGSFVQVLGEAFIRADNTNIEKLKNAFPELWEEYLHIGDKLQVLKQPQPAEAVYCERMDDCAGRI